MKKILLLGLSFFLITNITQAIADSDSSATSPSGTTGHAEDRGHHQPPADPTEVETGVDRPNNKY